MPSCKWDVTFSGEDSTMFYRGFDLIAECGMWIANWNSKESRAHSVFIRVHQWLHSEVVINAR